MDKHAEQEEQGMKGAAEQEEEQGTARAEAEEVDTDSGWALLDMVNSWPSMRTLKVDTMTTAEVDKDLVVFV
jgi:hypothetical protein